MTEDLSKDGNSSVSGLAILGSGMISHLRFSSSGPRKLSGLVFHPWIPNGYLFGTKTHVLQYILIITCLLRLLNLFYVDLGNYLLFIASFYTCECYIYHVYIYRKYLLLLLYCHTKWVSGIQSGFGYPRVSVLVMDFHPNRCSGRVRVLSTGFGFECPDTPPELNPPRCHPQTYEYIQTEVQIILIR